ncbi:hypothetical protein SUGI_0378010 [Cryptomeria japonica]|nr:hypothetical protein SUGI_0378010 [Cryptomeria japonica]
MAAGENGEESMPDDVIEIIVGFLPISDLPRAALVCKQWRYFIATSPIRRQIWHSIHKCKPWLFLFRAKKKRGLGFDLVAHRWIARQSINFKCVSIPNGSW